MRHKSTLFTLLLEMTRLVNETRLLLVPSGNSDIYGIYLDRLKFAACTLPSNLQTKHLRLHEIHMATTHTQKKFALHKIK